MTSILAKSSTADIIVAIAIFSGVLVMAFLVVMYLRKKVLGDVENGGSAEVFSLDELRKLHAAGSLSDEEYARAKQAIIGSVRSEMNSPQADQGQ